MGQRTALYDLHLALGAKMVDFGGWDMPLHYGSQVEEHHQVRRDCGVFDVSHMCVVDVGGDQAKAFLQHLLANDVARLQAPGKALYSAMLNEQGGVVDDLIVTAGGQQGMDIVARHLLSPGDRVILEQPAYFGAINVVRAAGAIPVPLKFGPLGFDLDQLEAAIQRQKPKLIIINPTFQNPTGHTVPMDQRRGLVELALRTGTPILEDDHCPELRFRGLPLPPLRPLLHENAPVLEGLADRIAAEPPVAALIADWAGRRPVYCGGQIEASLLNMLNMETGT